MPRRRRAGPGGAEAAGDGGQPDAVIVPLFPGQRDAPPPAVDAGLDDDLDDEEFLAAWGRAESEAAGLLRQALPEVAALPPPAAELAAAAARVRAGLAAGRWPYRHLARAAGWRRRPPRDDLQCWLGAAGGLVAMREESGLDPEEEAALVTLEFADWVGAVVGLTRAGVGARAEPADLVRHIAACPEIEGAVDPDEVALVELGFEPAVAAWEATGALDGQRRLTALGRWGLPRALAWAWGGAFGA